MSGTHMSGKTTLLNALKSVPEFEDYTIITGVADKYPRESRRSMYTQLAICNDLIRSEENVYRDFFPFIHDRTVIDNLAYSLMCRDTQPRFSNSFESAAVYRQIEDTVYKHLAGNAYNMIIFIDEFFPIEDNGTRCVSNTAQEFVYRFIKSFLNDWEKNMNDCDKSVNVVRVKGSTEERVKQVMKHVEVYTGS